MTMIRYSLLNRKCIFGNTFQFTKQFATIAVNNPTGLAAYNSLFKKKVPIFTKHPQSVTWYVCGPTVYDSSHIGHAWCYVNFDILRRIMIHSFDLDVVQVMNITDIDDKIIKKAEDQKIDFKEIAAKYEVEFLKDMDALGVMRPTMMTKVSEFLPQIMAFIEKLLQQGLAYETSDGSIYFNVDAYSKKYAYGKLKPSEISKSDIEKNSSLDFALWKGTKSPTEPYWTPSWGRKGRPGWHIECSVMASHLFGSRVDLHSGGIDLLFPHHENEEAQCCAYHETDQWVGHWIHSGHLNLSNGQKMSKSLKNFVTIKDFLTTHTADQFRMLCLISNYRNDMEFSEASLKLAKSVLDTVRLFTADCRNFIRNRSNVAHINSSLLLKTLGETKNDVKNHLADDFNTAQATKSVRHLIAVTQKEMDKTISNNEMSENGIGFSAVASVSNYVLKYFENLGFSFTSNVLSNGAKDGDNDLASFIDDVVEFRSEVRQHALKLNSKDGKDGDFQSTSNKILMASCDKLRSNLKKKGILLKDYPSNSTWTLTKS